MAGPSGVVRSVNNIMATKPSMVSFSRVFSGQHTALQDPAVVDGAKTEALQVIAADAAELVNAQTMAEYTPYTEIGIIPEQLTEEPFEAVNFKTNEFNIEFNISTNKQLQKHQNLFSYLQKHNVTENSSADDLKIIFNRLQEIPNLVDLLNKNMDLELFASKEELTDKILARNKKALADIFPETIKTIENKYNDISIKLKDEFLQINRTPEGSFEFLPADKYFAMTPKTPEIDGVKWRNDQILITSPEDLIEHTIKGKKFIQSNIVIPGLSAAGLGLPIAGTASRALKFALQHPELVDIIEMMGAMEGLDRKKGDLPPRYLYPLQTTDGIKTLCGLFVKHFIDMGNDAGVLSPIFGMLSEAGQKLTIKRLKNEFNLTDEQLEVMFGFIQPVAQRVYASDLVLTKDVFVTGHGDYATKFAQIKMYEAMVQMGIKYFAFSNADEFLSQGDYTMYSIFETLKASGYRGMVIAVPNSNNQIGGGIGNDKNPNSLQNYAYLREAPTLPHKLIEKGNNPKTLNTTIYLFDTEALAEINDDLLMPSPGLDMKNATARVEGGVEQALCLETWAGTEWTEKLARKYPIAYVYAPRAGIFTGIKSLEHTVSSDIPKELDEFPVKSFKNWHYIELVSYMASTYGPIVNELAKGNIRIAEEIFNNGFSYLIDPRILKAYTSIRIPHDIP